MRLVTFVPRARIAKPKGITFKLDAETLAGILLAASDGFVQAAQADPGDAKLFERFLQLFLPAVVGDDTTS